MEEVQMLNCGSECYITIDDIEMIVDSKIELAKEIRKNSSCTLNLVDKKNTRKSVILLKDGRAIYSPVLSITLAKRISAKGRSLVRLCQGVYLFKREIVGIFNFNSTLATQLRKNCENTGGCYSAIRGMQKRKSSILLRSDRVVNTRLTSKKVYESKSRAKPE